MFSKRMAAAMIAAAAAGGAVAVAAAQAPTAAAPTATAMQCPGVITISGATFTCSGSGAGDATLSYTVRRRKSGKGTVAFKAISQKGHLNRGGDVALVPGGGSSSTGVATPNEMVGTITIAGSAATGTPPDTLTIIGADVDNDGVLDYAQGGRVAQPAADTAIVTFGSN
jgi:hypothetical protein